MLTKVQIPLIWVRQSDQWCFKLPASVQPRLRITPYNSNTREQCSQCTYRWDAKRFVCAYNLIHITALRENLHFIAEDTEAQRKICPTYKQQQWDLNADNLAPASLWTTACFPGRRALHPSAPWPGLKESIFPCNCPGVSKCQWQQAVHPSTHTRAESHLQLQEQSGGGGAFPAHILTASSLPFPQECTAGLLLDAANPAHYHHTATPSPLSMYTGMVLLLEKPHFIWFKILSFKKNHIKVGEGCSGSLGLVDENYHR